MKRIHIFIVVTICLVFASALVLAAATIIDPAVPVSETQQKPITIRTENYPRPPYSGATYYIYERDDKVICTKLEVCNKFGDCEKTYKNSAFKEQEDIDTGAPYDKTDPVAIAPAKLKKHTCLTKFKLLP